MEKEFISERQAAILLKVHPETFRNWRKKGLLDKFIKIKNFPTLQRVSYDKKALLKWAEDSNLYP